MQSRHNAQLRAGRWRFTLRGEGYVSDVEPEVDHVALTDRGMRDDKLVCSDEPLNPSERRNVLRFFHFYARCKGLLNFWRRRPGRNACEGWCDAAQALARARLRDETWQGPPVDF